MLIETTHPYVEAIFNASLVAWENDGFIHEQLNRYYDSPFIEPYKFNHVQAYGLMLNGRAVIAINGTDGTKDDWENNLRAGMGRYYHDGIYSEYVRDLKPFVMDFSRTVRNINPRTPIYLHAHSQGAAEAQMALVDLREEFPCINTEAVVFCGPRVMSTEGKARAKSLGCRVTHLVMKGDIVDNVGGIEFKLWPPKISFAKHYGYVVNLPKVENHVLFGHKYSVVMKSIQKLFEKWKMPEQIGYIEEIKHVAKV